MAIETELPRTTARIVTINTGSNAEVILDTPTKIDTNTKEVFPHLAVMLGQFYFIKELSFREIKAYLKTVGDVRSGRYFKISDLFDELLADHELTVGGEDVARNIKPPFLKISNHPDKAPLDGHWHVQGTSSLMQHFHDQEMSWLFGDGRDKFNRWLEKWGLHNYIAKNFVNPIHKRIAECSDSIYTGEQRTRGKTPLSVWKQGGIVGLTPEGLEGTNLNQADHRSGILMRAARKRGLPVLAAGAYKTGKDLVINFGDASEHIDYVIEVASSEGLATEAANQLVADAGMERIAQLIIPERRGYYSYISD